MNVNYLKGVRVGMHIIGLNSVSLYVSLHTRASYMNVEVIIIKTHIQNKNASTIHTEMVH